MTDTTKKLRECTICGCQHLSDEIEQLQSENQQWCNKAENYLIEIERLESIVNGRAIIISEQYSEIKRLRDILSWYGVCPDINFPVKAAPHQQGDNGDN